MPAGTYATTGNQPAASSTAAQGFDQAQAAVGPTSAGYLTSPAGLLQFLLGSNALSQFVQAMQNPTMNGLVGTVNDPITGKPKPISTDFTVDPSGSFNPNHIASVPVKTTSLSDNPMLADEARRHQHDYAWMTAHGYTTYVKNVSRTDGQNTTTDKVVYWAKNEEGKHFLDMPHGAAATNEDLYGLFTGKGAPSATNADQVKTVKVGYQTMLNTLFGMDADQLTALQRKLADGGFYQGKSQPKFGTLDGATEDAFLSAMAVASNNPSKSFEDILGDNTDFNKDRLDRKAATAAVLASKGLGTGPDIKLTDKGALDQTITNVAVQLLGHDLSPEDRQRFIDQYHAKEEGAAHSDYARKVTQATQEAQGTTDQSVDAFLDQIHSLNSQHIAGNSGVGAYGIATVDWPAWVKRLGLPEGTPQTPQAEREIAKDIALTYYHRYGSWTDVASAYLSGAGQGTRMWQTSAAQPIRALADQVSTGMSQSAALAGGAAATGQYLDLPGTTTMLPPTPEEAAISATKAEHPLEYLGHEGAERFGWLTSMLGGLPHG